MPKLPDFEPNRFQQKWIDDEHVTAKIIQLLWRHASKADRGNPEFLKVLIRSSWVNHGSDEACRSLRNRHLAQWLGLSATATDEELVVALSERLGMTARYARWLVNTPSGITDYYKPYRPVFLNCVTKHARTIASAFRLVSGHEPDAEFKTERVARLIFDLPEFRTPNQGYASMMNGLAPVLACLDPQRRFPIMNARTRKLLSVLRHKANVEGALSLSRLIGHYGIKDSYYLDVYASTQGAKFKTAKRSKKVRVPDPKSVGLKSEEAAVANLAKRKVVIRKRHNALINKFLHAVEWKLVPKQSEYDLLIEDWKPGRWLLIEAKTETEGVPGRTQIRQAIGQLFDYRWRSFHATKDKVDLALLTPTKPGRDILDLLAELGIEALWFDRDRLTGSIALI